MVFFIFPNYVFPSIYRLSLSCGIRLPYLLLQYPRQPACHFGMLFIHICGLVWVFLQIIKLHRGCIRLYPGIFYIAVHPMGELESGCPAQVMVTDILSGKSAAVLRRNIDPLPFANGKMALLGRTDNNMVPNHFPGISDKGRKQLKLSGPVLLCNSYPVRAAKCGKHVNIGHQLVGYAARRNPTRPAGNHRNAMPAFPSSELETKKLAS